MSAETLRDSVEPLVYSQIASDGVGVRRSEKGEDDCLRRDHSAERKKEFCSLKMINEQLHLNGRKYR